MKSDDRCCPITLNLCIHLSRIPSIVSAFSVFSFFNLSQEIHVGLKLLCCNDMAKVQVNVNEYNRIRENNIEVEKLKDCFTF